MVDVSRLFRDGDFFEIATTDAINKHRGSEVVVGMSQSVTDETRGAAETDNANAVPIDHSITV